MASLFGDDGVDDLLNENVNDDELPGGDEFVENPFGDGDGAEDEQAGVKVEPKKRAVRNPRPRLTVETLRGPRGIQTIEEYFKDIKFRGKGHEKHDLDETMRRLQHWGHRMYPTYKFDDVLANIERLGKKKPLQVHMSRYRLGMLHDLNLQDADACDKDEDGANDAAADEPFDEFDALLGEQIAISKLAPRTPAQGNSRHSFDALRTAASTSNSTFATPSFTRGNAVMSTPYSANHHRDGDDNMNDSDFAQPLPPSQPNTPAPAKQLSADQLARIAENRRLAQERLRAKQLMQQQAQLETAEAKG